MENNFVLVIPRYDLYLEKVVTNAAGLLVAVGTPRKREALKFRGRSAAEKFRNVYLGTSCGMEPYEVWSD